MTAYSREYFEKIAAAIKKDVGDVVNYKQLFQWAADWYGLDCGLARETRSRPRRTPPSKMGEKLQRIAKSARRLLQALEIKSYEEADDGPGNFELLEILAAVEDQSEDAVVNAARRIGQLATILDAIEAATELERRALVAAKDVICGQWGAALLARLSK